MTVNFRDIRDASQIDGWMFGDELVWLSEQAAKSQSVVEVGCWKGRSTFALCAACPGTVYAVDTFEGPPTPPEGLRAEFLANIGSFPNLRMIERPSVAAASMFDAGEIDMVFIDASHEYRDVLRDITAWVYVAGCIIAGHDYAPAEWPGVVRAVDKIFGSRVKRAAESIWYVEL